ncbi:MAG: MerR family transcriptional regulator [Actinomycetota bacterium]|nr:MerR family transcriptional regulator [Actinomycetota bacterium]
MLAPPRLVGRTGYYGEAHVARLRLVAELQGRGFSLAGIKALVDARDAGRDLTDLLGGDDELVLTAAELAERFPPGSIGPDEVQRVVGLGLVMLLDDGRIRVRDRRFLDTGLALINLGVPAGEVLDQFEYLVVQTDEIAARFVDLFERHFYEPDAGAGKAGEALDELRTLAAQVVTVTLDASLARLGAQRLAEELAASDS